MQRVESCFIFIAQSLSMNLLTLAAIPFFATAFLFNNFVSHQPVSVVQQNPTTVLEPVKPCNEQLYAPEDADLIKTLGTKLPYPSKKPMYTGGLNALRAYLTPHNLTDAAVQGRTFRVRVAFLVNCEGKAGNFQIVSPSVGDMDPYAQKVLEITSKMPEGWNAATLGSPAKPIDCYQVITFTVVDGKLDRIMHR